MGLIESDDDGDGENSPPNFQRARRLNLRDQRKEPMMGRIVVSENVSLDGVMQDPTGEEGFKQGGWFAEISEADRAAWAERGLDEARDAAALLMGRRSDEYFAERWLSRTGEWAERLNEMPKYVVSSTIERATWSNSTVLSGDVTGSVATLKRELDGDIVVIASRPLVHTLMEQDLVDEVRLVVYPIVLGSGERVFGETAAKTPLRLLGARTVGDSLALLTYERA
jgi:dihydrofolate reductase